LIQFQVTADTIEGHGLKTTLLSCSKVKMAALSMVRPTVHRGAHEVYPI